MPKRVDFNVLVAEMIQQEGLSALRPVVEKSYYTTTFYFVYPKQVYFNSRATKIEEIRDKR